MRKIKKIRKNFRIVRILAVEKTEEIQEIRVAGKKNNLMGEMNSETMKFKVEIT